MPRPPRRPRPPRPPHSRGPDGDPYDRPSPPRKPFGSRPPERSSRPPHHERPGGRPSGFRADEHAEDGNQRGQFIARGVRIIHEDDEVVIVDKPPGLVTADPARAAGARGDMSPSARHGQTLFDFVKRHVREHTRATRRRRDDTGNDPNDRAGRVWIIHRLDKEASGLLVFAKTARAYESLKEQFRTKAAHRIYSAVAEGILGDAGFAGTRQSFISEDRGNDGPSRPPHSSRSGGPDSDKKFAVTHYRVVATGNDRSLLQVRLDTGRKNQIRVHMQELGHPLVGDLRFGARTDPIKRLGLHAAELGFVHPATSMTVRYNSPVPPSFAKAVGVTPAHENHPDTGRTSHSASHNPDRHSSSPAVPAEDTSWDDVAQWYDTLLEDKGNDHYERVILPAAIELLGIEGGHRVLDVACGQGILCRRLGAAGAVVTGLDASPRLIQAAKSRSPESDYRVGDARHLEEFAGAAFDAAACIMALGNIDPLAPLFRGVADALRPGGRFVAIVSHPGFRIPGLSEWGWDPKPGRQYRRIDAYLSHAKKQIKMHPGKAAHDGDQTATWSYHRPIGAYVNALAAAGLHIDRMNELISLRAADSGPRAPEENRARREIPLFLAIRAVKPPSER